MTQLRELTSALRHRDFRLLWSSQSLSVIGDQIITVAMALFVIDLTGSATDLGIVLAAHSLPLVAFILIGGIWADRLPRHRVVVVTDLIRFALQAVLALLIITDAVEIWHLVVISVLFGTAEAFYRPAVTALLPQTVPEAEIQQANALTSMSNNVGEFVGPALATLLVLGAGAGTAFALDAATFLVSAAVVIRLRPRRRAVGEEEPAAAAVGCREELREGWSEVRSRTWLWATLAAFCVAVFIGLAPWYVLGPLVATDQYGDLAVYGAVAAIFGAGTVIGSLVGIRWRPKYPMRMALLFVCLLPASQIVFAAGIPGVLLYPTILIGGIGLALFDVWWLTALAERIPPDRLSRVSSYDWLVSLGLVPLGFLLAGPLATEFGAVPIMIIGSAISLVALLAALLPRDTRMLERLDSDEHLEALGEPQPGLPT